MCGEYNGFFITKQIEKSVLKKWGEKLDYVSLHFFRALAASCVLYNRREDSQGPSFCKSRVDKVSNLSHFKRDEKMIAFTFAESEISTPSWRRKASSKLWSNQIIPGIARKWTRGISDKSWTIHCTIEWCINLFTGLSCKIIKRTFRMSFFIRK